MVSTGTNPGVRVTTEADGPERQQKSSATQRQCHQDHYEYEMHVDSFGRGYFVGATGGELPVAWYR
jgi:hypothetical protein